MTCSWKEGGEGEYWSTSCGHMFSFIAGSPNENEMSFCCYCGLELDEVILSYSLYPETTKGEDDTE